MEVLRQVGLRNEPLLIWSEFIISNSERTNSTILDNLFAGQGNSQDIVGKVPLLFAYFPDVKVKP